MKLRWSVFLSGIRCLFYSRSSATDPGERQVSMAQVKPECPKQCWRDRTGCTSLASDTVPRQHGYWICLIQPSSGTQLQWHAVTANV